MWLSKLELLLWTCTMYISHLLKKSSIGLYHVETIISIWQMRKLGLQQGYTPDPESQSQLVLTSMPHFQPWVTVQSLSQNPLSLSCHWTWWVSWLPQKVLRKRRAAKLCPAKSLLKTCHCWNILSSHVIPELASRDSFSIFSIVFIEWPRGEIEEAYIIIPLTWVNLRCNNMASVIKSKVHLQDPSAIRDLPKEQFWGPEILSSLLSHHALPNAVHTHHINQFIINPLPDSLSSIILSLLGREVIRPLVRQVHASLSQWSGIFMGPS